MIDHNQVVNDLQRELAERLAKDGSLVNVPGKSLACRVDPWYFLALYPALVERMAAWLSLKPEHVREALVRTGILVTAPPERKESLKLTVIWDQGARQGAIEACFLHSEFVDRAVELYGRGDPPPLSELRIAGSERDRVESFLAGKSPLESLAYAE